MENGPFDVDEAPADEIPRIDLGSLRVPMIDGLELRLDVDQQTGEPAQLVLADGESMLQLAGLRRAAQQRHLGSGPRRDRASR